MKTIFTLLFSIGILYFFSACIADSESLIQEKNKSSFESKSKEALEFCLKNNFNKEICILVDMSIHSGKNRLALWNFKSDSILVTGLCSHGCGKNNWGADNTKLNPIFSNITDSHCSSLGKYKIGKRGYSQWGININYKIHGLEESNNKAYDRFIVLHSWDMIPEKTPFPEGTPEGWGCPAVSNNTLKKLDDYLKDSENPILLWVYQ